MKYVSFSLILTLIFAGYVINTIWTLAEIFIPPECSRGERCFTSYLASKPVQHLVLYTSVRENPYTDDGSADSVQKVHTGLQFDYEKPATFDVLLQIPPRTRKNGTLFLHAVLIDKGHLYKEFMELKQTQSMHTLSLITYTEPQAETFKLLQQEEKVVKPKTSKIRPYSHISTFVPLSILTDNLNLPANKIPQELYGTLRLRHTKFLPIIQHNVLKSRISQLQLLNSTTKEVNVTISVAPTSYGSLRLAIHVQLALQHLKSLGFGEKDVDDVKGIFADTNLYLLSATVLIATAHLLFDFLAFKNDVSFWRRARSLAGLSARTVCWRAFSQLVVFCYLLDERTSMLVLAPAGVSALIELWKVSKVLHIRVSFAGWRARVWRDTGAAASERSTARADAEAMKYLSLLLYPLCIGGAAYSLLYETHKSKFNNKKFHCDTWYAPAMTEPSCTGTRHVLLGLTPTFISWYSWALHSVVSGVYAFGFLFMLPQLFVNYRLRSVAALPWRAFMYKAFNTFIDDVFAFVITMPTAHRVACFRDDLVFLVYLYQRWLYPVDKSRMDTGASMHDCDEEPDQIKTKTE